jgi:hypothetical protein
VGVKNAKVEFTLMKEGARFTDSQKELIEYHICLEENWERLKDLSAITFESISDTGFIVNIEESGKKWYAIFSQILCRKVYLFDLRVTSNANYRLFDPKYLT